MDEKHEILPKSLRMSSIALPKPILLGDIADFVGADLKAKDRVQSISSIASLEAAGSESLCFFQSLGLVSILQNCKAKAVFVSQDHMKDCPAIALVVDNPRLAWAKVSTAFFPRYVFTAGISEYASISATAKCGGGLSVGDFASIGDRADIGNGSAIGASSVIGAGVQLGEFCQIGSNVHIYPGTVIGRGCIIHSGSVIGADGFGFEADDKGHWHKVEQRAGVIVGNYTEIGANSAIDSGALEPTSIGDGVKIDNLVQIGHGVRIGAHSLICSGCSIGGSTIIGANCILAGRVDIVDNISLADKTTVKARSFVTASVKKQGKVIAGALPARTDKYWARWISELNILRKKEAKS